MKKRLLILGLLIASFAGNAQTAVTNTGILFITGNTDIFYAGSDFTNTSTLLTNNGQLYVRGNLTNNQTPGSIGTGTLHLNGSAAQIVGGTASFKTFNLNTNNTSGGIAINTNLSISGTHTFTSGLITTATSRYLVYEDDAIHTGASNAAHVNGWVKKIGNDNFTLPVGNASYLREIAISNLSAPMEINGTYSGATQNTLNLQLPLRSINPIEYWTLDNITAGATTAQITLNWDESKVPFPNYVLEDIRSAQYNSGNWTSTGGSATGTVATSGSITSTALNTFGELSIGSISAVLPLYFLNISAKRKEGYTAIEWKTADEINVKQHEVQRSYGSSAFVTIGTVPARNTRNIEVYNFNDSDNLIGTVYYRIRSVDIDGSKKYSKVVSVYYTATNETITLKNNPVRSTINLALSSTDHASFYYQIITASGSNVQRGNIQYGGTGSLSITLNSNIVGGTYILLLNTGKKLFTQKLIVNKD